MQVAVAVSGVERLYRDGDKKIALSFMADSLAARVLAHAVRLMQWVRHVVRYAALLQDPLPVGGKGHGNEKKKERQCLPGHRVCELWNPFILSEAKDLCTPAANP